MLSYMVLIALPKDFTEEFVSLIPLQRAQVAIWMQTGRLVQYAVSSDRASLWIIAHGESEKEIQSLVAGMPLHKFLKVVSVQELMFHEQRPAAAPQNLTMMTFSLN